ncbi:MULTISPECIES: VOC family protein [unclassified Mycobacterium]|uniref:VOC family protein n=1 Tax=unclassified Mycobacterium TaxID=2642494 RepID=UPI0029C810B6|nr:MULTISPECIES: VOC family protein [unclassified Mycobacterium]
MKLNHLDLQVADVRATAALFQSLFGLRLQSNSRSSSIAILGDGDGFVLVLQRTRSAAETYPSGFHFGFTLESVATVHDVQARARALQLDVTEVIENNRGTMVYCRMPDGYLVEVSSPRR